LVAVRRRALIERTRTKRRKKKKREAGRGRRKGGGLISSGKAGHGVVVHEPGEKKEGVDGEGRKHGCILLAFSSEGKEKRKKGRVKRIYDLLILLQKKKRK